MVAAKQPKAAGCGTGLARANKIDSADLKATRDFHYRIAAFHVACGDVICYPTEAVFGLGCNPDNPDAVRTVLKLKQRHWQQGLILIGADCEQLRHFCALNDADWHRICALWPAAKTIVVPTATDNRLLTGRFNTIALRVPDHPQTRALCRQTGPLVSTSANPHGRPPARCLLTARHYFARQSLHFVPGETAGHLRPSTIVHWRDGTILRR